MSKKRYLVCGAGGFIGGHLVENLRIDGHEVVCVDSKPYEYWFQINENNKNYSLDLKEYENCLKVTDRVRIQFSPGLGLGTPANGKH